MSKQIEASAALGSDFVAFPETCTVGFGSGKQMGTFAEDADGRTFQYLKRLAQDHNIAVGYGYPETGSKLPYNSYQVIGSTGISLVNYRKSRLFGQYEKEVFEAGRSSPTVFKIGDLKFVVLICYEIMFPELSLAAAPEGAHVLVYPSAGETSLASSDFNRSITSIRALECGSYVMYPNCCGNDGTKSYRGRSVMAGPDGTLLAEVGETPAIFSADVNFNELETFRRESHYIADRMTMPRLIK